MSFFSAEKNKKSAFDELLVSELTPIVALQFPYNINQNIIESRENNLGTVTQSGGMALMQSGASANSAAHLLSRTPLKYNPGLGAAVRFSAIFTTGVAGSVQLVGLGEVGDGLFFGFNGAVFSVLRRELGNPEIQTLTITVGASTAYGNITINLDGVATTVEVVPGDSAREVAVKIADADFSDAGLGWSAFANNSTVIFKAWSDGDKSGTFSLVDTDATGAAGNFLQTVVGASTVLEWIAQTDWNEDPFDGSGKSGVTLDTTKGNIYQIQYQWLGFGQLLFFIENPDTGKMEVVHKIKYANANIVPSLQNPTLPLHVMSKNTSNTTNLTVKTGSMGGFVEGRILNGGMHHSVEKSLTGVTTTEVPVLSIKNKIIYQSVINRVRMQVGFLSISTDVAGNKSFIIRVRKNGTLTGAPAFTDHETDISVASEDTSATGITITSRTITSFSAVFGAIDSKLIDYHIIDGILNPGDIFTITAQTTSGTGDVTASIVWVDLF